MLMMLCRDLRSDIHFVRVIEGLVRLQAVGIDDTGCFHFKLDRTVKGKVEIEAILVIGYCTDGGDDQLSITSDVNSHVSEIGMFVKYTRIFFTKDMSVTSLEKSMCFIVLTEYK
jgi:hypothetical protein